MNSEYVCVGTPEETVLETYFVMLSKFNFERAKEQCEKERESKSGLGGTNWCEFMNLLCKLAVAEMNYYNLNFVERSWLKREPLRTTYEILLQEFKKVHEVYFHGRGGTDFSWEKRMTELLSSIMEYVIARKDMIDFYKGLDIQDSCFINHHHSDRVLKDIHERHNEGFRHTYLKPIYQCYWSEVGILSDLMKIQHQLSNWQFLHVTLSVQSSHSKLSSWCGVHRPGVQLPDSTPRLPSIRSRPIPQNVPSSSTPPLYKWLCTFHNSLLAKFTLYFYQILGDNGVLNNVKGLHSKFETDYIQSFHSLVRTTNTSCVCLIFDSNGIEGFQGPEYRLPGSPTCNMVLTGLNSYPTMISIPQDFDFLPHKANIVSMIMSRGLSSPSTGLSTHHDTKLYCTYHLAQVDPRVTLVAVLSTTTSRTRERDSPVVTTLTGSDID